MPLGENEVDTSAPFQPDEMLYRRVLRSEELSDGEIYPTGLESVKFDKNAESAPSVLRSAFASAADALHRDCASQKDVSDQFVYSIRVAELPEVITCDTGKQYSVFPLHAPLPTCGAHSVISCCNLGDSTRTYQKPSRSARNDLRVKLATRL